MRNSDIKRNFDHKYEYNKKDALSIKIALVIILIASTMFKLPRVVLLVSGVVLTHISLCYTPPSKSIAALSDKVRMALFFILSISSALLLKFRWVALVLILWGLAMIYIFHIIRRLEHADEKLFKQPPKPDDCPICFLRLPFMGSGKRFHECCGKMICSGCVHAPVYDDEGNEIAERTCPFCRTPDFTSNEECIKQLMKRVEVNDAEAIYFLGIHYNDGDYGLARDNNKALKFWKQAGELGHAEAYHRIARLYMGWDGQGVEENISKAIHYLELAAIRGSVEARGCLGNAELREPFGPGDVERALKHYKIGAEGGDAESLHKIKQLYSKGHVSKDDYAYALSVYQRCLDEIRSTKRDEAAAFSEDYQYYGLPINYSVPSI